VVLKALAKKPEERWESAGALIAALNAGTDDVAAPVSAEPLANEARSRLLLGAVAVLLASVVGGLAVWRSNSNRAPRAMRVAAPLVTDAGSSSRAVVIPAVLPDAGAREIEVNDTALAVSAAPRNATIEIDGVIAGTGEIDQRFAHGSRHRVVVSAPGFAPYERDVVLAQPEALSVVLDALPTAGVVHAVRDAGRVVRVESSQVAADGGAGPGAGGGTAVRVGDPGGDGLKGSPYGGGG
jgi:hypothetical protein